MKPNTPQQFALQLGALLSLYVSLASLITLLFSTISIVFPDAADSSWQSRQASESIRFAFATLLIFFPVYITLTRIVNNTRRKSSGEYLSLTRWLIYLSLVVGGGILLGDAVAVLYSFLNGELTLRFFLKAAVLAVVVKMAFAYYLLDVRSYWRTHEHHSLYYGLATTVIVVAALVWGFTNMQSPAEVRAERIDNEQLADLQDIQYRIEQQLMEAGELPVTIDELYTVGEAPSATEDRSAYRYELTDDGFELCAEFGTQSDPRDYGPLRPTMLEDKDVSYPYIKNPNDWEHEAGKWCFERQLANIDQ